jgi:hypothetical protein
VTRENMDAPIGSIEPHAGMLTVPGEDELLFKVMGVDNFLASMRARYLHFNRIDLYSDFPSADPHDGEQTPLDRLGNSAARFLRSPGFSAADYYDLFRRRAYACCFSMANTPSIWNYGHADPRGKVCLVGRFGKLRERINQGLGGGGLLIADGVPCRQMFDLNYGKVDYVEWSAHRANTTRLPNSVRYLYLKDLKFKDENELRISLSTCGFGQFQLANGETLEFQRGLQLTFDLRQAMADGIFEQLLHSPDCDVPFLHEELARCGICAVDERGKPSNPALNPTCLRPAG